MKYILRLMIVGLLFSSCGNTNNSVNPTEKNLASKVAYADEINKVVVFESHYKMLCIEKGARSQTSFGNDGCSIDYVRRKRYGNNWHN
jgi:hypothetical protein